MYYDTKAAERATMPRKRRPAFCPDSIQSLENETELIDVASQSWSQLMVCTSIFSFVDTKFTLIEAAA